MELIVDEVNTIMGIMEECIPKGIFLVDRKCPGYLRTLPGQ